VTVAVTGATGYVGRFIVHRLLEEGLPVRAWRRPGSDLRGTPPGIHWVDGDLSTPDAAPSLVGGADMLVHSALQHLPGLYRGGEGGDLATFLRVNVGETLALLAAARQAGVRRCVFLSSRAVFGGRSGEGTISDAEIVRPDSNYGAAKAAVEVFVESWGREGWAISGLRPTGVYGVVAPVENSKWFDLIGRVLRGETVPARSGTEVHGRDVADAVWRILQADPSEVAGRMFNCSDIAVSTRDIAIAVQQAAGASGPLPESSPPPRNVVDCAGLQRLRVEFGGRPLFERTIAELVAAHRFATQPLSSPERSDSRDSSIDLTGPAAQTRR
jgi:nucleoside-diphosphate-sugar epimerase